MSALRNPVIGLLTLHMSKPSQHATTNNTIHTLDTQPTPELFTFSSVLQGHSRHPPNHTILHSHKAFAYQPPSSAKFRYHTQAPSVHTLYISFPSLSMKLPSLSTTLSNP